MLLNDLLKRSNIFVNKYIKNFVNDGEISKPKKLYVLLPVEDI